MYIQYSDGPIEYLLILLSLHILEFLGTVL